MGRGYPTLVPKTDVSCIHANWPEAMLNVRALACCLASWRRTLCFLHCLIIAHPCAQHLVGAKCRYLIDVNGSVDFTVPIVMDRFCFPRRKVCHCPCTCR